MKKEYLDKNGCPIKGGDILMNEDGEEVWKRNGEAMREIAYRRYCWNVIANKYERLYLKN